MSGGGALSSARSDEIIKNNIYFAFEGRFIVTNWGCFITLQT